MASEGTNRAIVKNTLILYVRSFIMMAIGIFTTRIILQAVGVENFGLYGVVGSVISMFTILNGVLSAGSSRFLTFELGRKDAEKLKKTFSASFAMHFAMAIVLLVAFETVGLWFVNHKINIPEGRGFAANVVYQLSVFSCLLSITQVPYGAVIIAREKFDIFAYVGIGEAIFKCVLPLSLLYLDFSDNLIAYAIICTVWSVGLQMFYRIYCYRRFPETHLSICREKSIYRSMLGYSLWDLLGQFCASGNTQGLNILINLFFGVRLNASRSLAYTVDGKITQFNGQFLTSVTPQITKSYAQRSYRRFFELIYESGRCSFFLLFLLSLPVFLEADYLISVWLVEVPPMTVLFLRLIIIHTLIRSPSRPIITGVHATGDVRFLNLTSGLLVCILYLPSIYVFYKIGMPVWFCFVTLFSLDLVCDYIEALALKRRVMFSLADYFKSVYLKSILALTPAVMLSILPICFLPQNFARCAITCLLCAFSTLVSVYCFGITAETRRKVKVFLHEKGFFLEPLCFWR